MPIRGSLVAFSAGSQGPTTPSATMATETMPNPHAAPGPAAAHVVDRRHRDGRAPGRQRWPHPRDVAPPRRARAALDARRPAHRDRPADRALRDVSRADPARPDVAQPVARPGVRDGRAWPRRTAGSGSPPSGCCSRTSCSSTVGYSLGDGSTVVGEFLTLVTTYPYVLMAARQRRPVRAGGDQLGPCRPAPSRRTRRGTASTCTRISRSRSGSCTSSTPAPTSSTTRSRSATGSRSTSRPPRSSSSSGSGSRSGCRCATGCASRPSSTRGPASSRSTSPGATSTSWRSAPASTSCGGS